MKFYEYLIKIGLLFLILCIIDVTEAHRCKQRNENHVIHVYHHFVERILTDFEDMEDFFFSYEFPNFVVHSYQFEPLRKNENAQNMVINIKTFKRTYNS